MIPSLGSLHLWLVRSLYFPVFLQIRNLPSPVSRSQAHTPPRFRGAFAPGFCIVASLTPNRGVGGAPRNVRVLGETPVGRAILRHKTRVNALMTRDARLSALHRGGFGPRGRASVSFGARRPTTAGSCLADPCSELLAARS